MHIIGTALTVTILKKEVVTLYAGSTGIRERLVAEFRECIDAAGSCKSKFRLICITRALMSFSSAAIKQEPTPAGPCTSDDERHDNGILKYT